MNSWEMYKREAGLGQRLRVGLDLDGVLADWFLAVTHVAKRAGLIPAAVPGDQPKHWDLLEAGIGFTEESMRKVFFLLRTDPKWQNFLYHHVSPFPDLAEARRLFTEVAEKAEVHIITAREFPYQGHSVVAQTAGWLERIKFPRAGLVMAGDKAAAAVLLNLDFYLDDRAENAEAVANADVATQAFVLARPYNTETFLPRVTLGEFAHIVLDTIKGEGEYNVER